MAIFPKACAGLGLHIRAGTIRKQGRSVADTCIKVDTSRFWYRQTHTSSRFSNILSAILFEPDSQGLSKIGSGEVRIVESSVQRNKRASSVNLRCLCHAHIAHGSTIRSPQKTLRASANQSARVYHMVWIRGGPQWSNSMILRIRCVNQEGRKNIRTRYIVRYG